MKTGKEIVITGAFGFVGSNLSKSIKEALNAFLIAVDVFEPENHNYDRYVNWSKLHLINWQNIDVIIHLAGKAHDTKNKAVEKDYMDINLGLTKQIFGHFYKSGASKFIFFSSVKAAADEVKGEILYENEIPNPKTSYGKSKLKAENFLLNQKLPNDKKVYILRPCMIHGPGNKGNLNLLHQIVQTGVPWPLGRFNNKRSFTSIDNLNHVIKLILETEIDQGIYQMADDECLSTNQLVELISKSKGKKTRIWKINKKLISQLAKIGDTVHLPLNSERLKKLTESYVVSNYKLKKSLKIKKMPITAEEGVKRTLSSF